MKPYLCISGIPSKCYTISIVIDMFADLFDNREKKVWRCCKDSTTKEILSPFP